MEDRKIRICKEGVKALKQLGYAQEDYMTGEISIIKGRYKDYEVVVGEVDSAKQFIKLP